MAYTGSVSSAVPQSRIYRIGFFGTANEAGYASLLASFRSGLRELGWQEGKNIEINYTWANGKYAELNDLAQKLVSTRPDVLVTHGTPGTAALQKATQDIPIVMTVSGEAVASGLIKSFSDPGGNTTGQSFLAADMSVKRIELLLEAAPRLTKIATVFNARNSFAQLDLRALRAATAERSVELKSFAINSAAELENIFGLISKENFEAVSIIHDAVLTAAISTLADLSLRFRLLSIGEPSFVKAGGLIGYGPDLHRMWHEAANYVHKLLKGARAADLPVQIPTKFETILNAKTAHALNINFSATLLARADDVLD